MKHGPVVRAIAAIGRNRELGKGNELLWHIPDDLKRFKQLSMGHPIILGRKTFESIVATLGKPLPGRTNIVVTRDPEVALRALKATPPTGGVALSRGDALPQKDVVIAGSIDEALEKAKQAPGSEEIIIGGGAQIYEQALPYTDRLYLTLVDDSKEADSFFPEYEHVFTKKVSEQKGDFKGLGYRWVDLEKA